MMKVYGCEFVSVSESFDTNGVMGRAMMGEHRTLCPDGEGNHPAENDALVQEIFDQEEIQEYRLLYGDLNTQNKKMLYQRLIRQILLFEDGTVQIISKENGDEI